MPTVSELVVMALGALFLVSLVVGLGEGRLRHHQAPPRDDRACADCVDVLDPDPSCIPLYVPGTHRTLFSCMTVEAISRSACYGRGECL